MLLELTLKDKVEVLIVPRTKLLNSVSDKGNNKESIR